MKFTEIEKWTIKRFLDGLYENDMRVFHLGHFDVKKEDIIFAVENHDEYLDRVGWGDMKKGAGNGGRGDKNP